MKANFIDIVDEFDYGDSVLDMPAWIVRENQVRGLLKAYAPFLDELPPLRNDDLDDNPSLYPEFCQGLKAVEGGKSYTVWIYFKPNLSVTVATLYFDSVNRNYIASMLQAFFTYFNEAIKLVEVDGVDGKYSFAIKDISKATH